MSASIVIVELVSVGAGTMVEIPSVNELKSRL
jgi:hypothetical protein